MSYAIDPADFDNMTPIGGYSAKQLAAATERNAAVKALNKDSRPHPATSDLGYDDDDREWLMAYEAYRKRNNIKFLLATDFLKLARELGYSKD